MWNTKRFTRTRKATTHTEGGEHKRRSSHQRSTAKRSGAEWSLGGVGSLADGELTRRLLQRLSGGVDGQVVRRPRCSELPRRFEPSRRSEQAASAFSPVGVVLGLGVVSRRPSGLRDTTPTGSARTVVVGARSVTRPLTGDNCAVRAHCRELRRLSRCLISGYLPITARGRRPSMLLCNVRDNDTYCPASSESAR